MWSSLHVPSTEYKAIALATGIHHIHRGSHLEGVDGRRGASDHVGKSIEKTGDDEGKPWGNHGEIRKTKGKIMKSHGEKREKYREMPPPEVYFNSVWENASTWWMLKCHVSLGKWEKVAEFTNGDKIGIYWDIPSGKRSHNYGQSPCY